MTIETILVPERRPFFALVWGMIRRPSQTLEYISQHGGANWLIMALLATLIAILPILAASPVTARQAEEVIQAQLEAQAAQGQAITPEMSQQVSQFATNPVFTVLFPTIGAIIVLWLGWLIWSGVLHLAATMLGGSSRFAQLWQIVVWSWLPYSLRGLLQTVFIFTTGELIANPGLSGLVVSERTATQILLSPPGPGQLALQNFLSRLDLFLVWNLALMVIGVVASARLSPRKAVLITLGVWAIFTLFGMISAMLPSLFLPGSF